MKRLHNIKNYKGKVKWMKQFFRVMNELGIESVFAVNKQLMFKDNKGSSEGLVIHVKWGGNVPTMSEEAMLKIVEGFKDKGNTMQYDIIGAVIPYLRKNYMKSGEQAWAVKDFQTYDYLQWLDELENNTEDYLEEIEIRKAH